MSVAISLSVMENKRKKKRSSNLLVFILSAMKYIKNTIKQYNKKYFTFCLVTSFVKIHSLLPFKPTTYTKKSWAWGSFGL